MSYPIGNQPFRVLIGILAIPALFGCVGEAGKQPEHENVSIQTVELELLEPPQSADDTLPVQAPIALDADAWKKARSPDLARLADAVISLGESSQEAQEAFEASVRDVLRGIDSDRDGSDNEKASPRRRKPRGSGQRSHNVRGERT